MVSRRYFSGFTLSLGFIVSCVNFSAVIGQSMMMIGPIPSNVISNPYIPTNNPNIPNPGVIGPQPPPPSGSASTNQLLIWSANSSNIALASQSRATTLDGVPVPSLTATQAIGTRGEALLQDFILIDKLASFARERIPERVAHAKGAGAHGFFVVNQDISMYTKAKFLNGIGKITPVFVRFSTSVGESGTADTAVDPHGFGIKFYSEDGNHDIVGNSIESFALRDPMLFADINRSRKRNPQTNLFDQNSWWDFVSLRPESTLHTLHLFSDLGRPDGYRRNDGFGVHAFKFVNETGGVVFGKFVFKSLQTAPAMTHVQAKALAGSNPDYFTQDLFDAIARKEFPSWDLYVQIMTIDQVRTYRRNPFDITGIWRHDEIPLIPVGRMTLDRNPTNFFAEVEQAAFAPSNMVPGIEPSPDRMLAARLFSYQDAQRYRLTTNGVQLPINRPVSPVTSYIRSGLSCSGDNGGSSPNYFPNSFGGVRPDTIGAGQASFGVEGIVDRFDIPEDEYFDARLFLERDVDPANRRRMVLALADRLKKASTPVWERVLQNNFYPVQKQFGDEVRAAVLEAIAADNQQNASPSAVPSSPVPPPPSVMSLPALPPPVMQPQLLPPPPPMMSLPVMPPQSMPPPGMTVGG